MQHGSKVKRVDTHAYQVKKHALDAAQPEKWLYKGYKI